MFYAKMKKAIALMLALLMVLSLAACSNSSTKDTKAENQTETKEPETAEDAGEGEETEEPEEAEEPEQAEEAGEADGETITWIYANVGAADIVANVHMEQLAAEVAEKTNGGFVIECYHNSSMGDNREIVEGMQFGTIQMTLGNISTLSGYSDKIGVVETPYLFGTLDGAYNVFVESDVLQPIYDDMAELGLYWVTGWYQGYRVLTTTKTPVHTPEDMKGLKIRTMESENHMAHFNTLGANAIPMSFSEVFTALQQGAIDGQENPYVQIFTQGINEVQGYIIETNHICDVMPLLVSQKAFDALPEEYQNVLLETIAEYTKKVWDATEEDIVRIKGEITATGKTEIIELTEEEHELFVEAAQPVWELIEGKVGSEFMQSVIAAANG